MTKLLTPSIVRMSGSLEERASMINVIGCERIHIDVSVGYTIPDFFVCGIFAQADRELFTAPVDFHVFTQGDGSDYDALPLRLGDRVILHAFPWMEIAKITNTLTYFRQRGFEVGLSLDLESPSQMLQPHLHLMEVALVMGIEAGGRGLPLNEKALSVLADLRDVIREDCLALHLGIDGGVNATTFERLAAVCDILVIGSFLFNTPDIFLQWRSLNRWLRRIESGR